MATKDELVAFGQAHGIAVDMSMLKVDIEAAISAAGYDPYTLGEPAVGTEEPPAAEAEDLTGTSSDARFSTYAEAPTDREAEYPPPGRQVEQTRGQATETP